MSTISSEILHNAVENLDIDQLQEYYLYDESDHKSLLIEHVSESCYTGFRYFESFLEHVATDHVLNKVTPVRRFVSNNIFYKFWGTFIRFFYTR